MELRIEQQAKATERWVEIDLWGKVLGGKQAALDVEIGEWLLAARDAEVHRYMACGSFVEYARRRLGLDPHSINERVGVADALQGLPLTRQALARGQRSWTAVRELTRVATPETEGEWLRDTEGRTAKDVQDLVAGRRPGQTAKDPTDPRLVRHVLRFEVSSEAFALFREAVRALQRTTDPRLSDEEALGVMARAVLGGPGDEGRAPYQVALVQCEDCGRVWQDARGESVELTPEVAERAACDGQFIGRVDGESPEGRMVPEGRAAQSPRGPKKASQTIPPAVRRQVLRGIEVGAACPGAGTRPGSRSTTSRCGASTAITIHRTFWPRAACITTASIRDSCWRRATRRARSRSDTRTDRCTGPTRARSSSPCTVRRTGRSGSSGSERRSRSRRSRRFGPSGD